jgi:uncharacterized protein (DUF983 family)
MRKLTPRRTESSRHTESPLTLPTFERALAVAWRVLRLRCPHCGRGSVLQTPAAVRPRCGGCGLRFERSSHNYFSGAMFFGLLIGETLFAIALAATMIITWPSVPWDAMTYVAPIGMIVVMLTLLPVSKVVWLGVDVLVRPVTPSELELPAANRGPANSNRSSRGAPAAP